MNNLKITDYGYTDQLKEQALQYGESLIPARITAVFQGMYEIATDYGISKAKLKGNYILNNPSEEMIPTVGDFVLVDYQEGSISPIHYLLPRSSILARKAPTDNKKNSQLIGANIDYAFIVTSMNKDFSAGRIERYLTAIYQAGITPILLLSKSDLADNINEYLAMAGDAAPGVDVICNSTVTMEGMKELSEMLVKGKTVIFIGSSGVGKSSLLNAVAGTEIMQVNDIREDDARGRHTTTHRQLLMLDSGCMLIDTPGMREFSLIETGSGVDETFSDIHELAQQCHFSDCSHGKEIKCAVKNAIDEGRLDPKRLIQYNKQKKVEEFYEKKDYLKNKEKTMKKYFEIGREARKRKNYDGYDY
ncbi:MAG: ribosome small subunit-dependent GTPase A [Clostridia bacterium]|nr:ribosome small subunit-dependent GTPase A [Clostridia bacterium]